MKNGPTVIQQLRSAAYEKRDQQNECCAGLYKRVMVVRPCIAQGVEFWATNYYRTGVVGL